MANNDYDTTQRMPNTSYNSQYPYNSSDVTEAGHFFEVDNTPGAARIRYGHKAGTYTEIAENGRKVEVSVNDHAIYCKGGLTITSDKNSDIKLGGHGRFSFGKDMHMEIGANGSIVMQGTGTVVCQGSISFVVQGDATVVAGGDLHAKVGGNANVAVGGSLNAEISSDTNIKSKTATITADTINLVGEVHLGSKGGVPAAIQGTIDTAGNADISNLAQKVFIT